MSQEAKSHHYVPRFYLKNFASGRKGKATFWKLDKQTLRTFPASVASVACENFFYDATDSNGNVYRGEAFTRIVDGVGSKLIKSILNSEVLPIDDEIRYELCIFVAFQYLRVPTRRNVLNNISAHIAKHFFDHVESPQSEQMLKDLVNADTKAVSVNALLQAKEYAVHLFSKQLFLEKAPKGHHFITSDNPVVLFNHYDYGPRGGLGLAKEGIQIMYPISTRLCLTFVCDKLANRLRESLIWRNMIDLQRLNGHLVLEPENIEFANSHQVTGSERWVFAEKRESLAIAESMIKEHPNLSNPSSENIQFG